MSTDLPFNSEFRSIPSITGHEFRRVIFDPLSIVVFLFLLLLVFLEGLRSTVPSGGYGSLVARLIYGLYPMGQYFAAVAMFIGATSLAEERSRNSLSVLLTKPLYRRDVILGKFIGLNIFLLLFVFSVYFAYAAVLFTLVGVPVSMPDFVLRCSSLSLAMFFESSLAMSLAMMAGVFFKILKKK